MQDISKQNLLVTSYCKFKFSIAKLTSKKLINTTANGCGVTNKITVVCEHGKQPTERSWVDVHLLQAASPSVAPVVDKLGPVHYYGVVRQPVGDSVQTASQGRGAVLGEVAILHHSAHAVCSVDDDGSPSSAAGKYPVLEHLSGRRDASLHAVVDECAVGNEYLGIVTDDAVIVETDGEPSRVTPIALPLEDVRGAIVSESAIDDCRIATVVDVHSSL